MKIFISCWWIWYILCTVCPNMLDLPSLWADRRLKDNLYKNGKGGMKIFITWKKCWKLKKSNSSSYNEINNFWSFPIFLNFVLKFQICVHFSANGVLNLHLSATAQLILMAPPSISDPQPNWRDFFAKISVTTKIQKPEILVKISVTPNWLKTGFFVTRQSSHFLGSRPGIVDFRRESAAVEKILVFRGPYCRFTRGICHSFEIN